MLTGLLDGVRVLDLSRVLAGPFAGQVLAEMGADVVKVELSAGDPARTVGPHVAGRSLYFSAVNTGKRGVQLDLARAGDRDRLEALIGAADVVLENFRPSAAEHVGVLAAQLLARHPRLIVVTVSGYARSSDRADRGTYDVAIQAESGVMSVTGEPGRLPVRAGVPVSDLTAGLWAAFAVAAGLVARDRTGQGRHIDVPLLDATLPLLSYMATTASHTGVEPGKVGSGHHSIVPYRAYPTRDGSVVVAALTDKFWPALARAVPLGQIADRPELLRNEGRLAARDEVDRAVAEALSPLSTAEAVERLEAEGVPCAPVLGVLEALKTDYVRARRLAVDVDSPEGPYTVVQGPLRAGRPPRPAPGLGEHTEEVLAEWTGTPGEQA